MSIRDDRINEADRPCTGCLIFVALGSLFVIAHIIVVAMVISLLALLGAPFVAAFL